ncbi:helix-turn-helix domain-containing protein [Cellvibrio sp. pealriver]|uniref:winged helix-turn-helix transcriptional regulator n=1 Tax=Cellvibrio sp. pealriver TaxID=1622269 RepID=UPI00066FC3D6|nr:helix-turn-helix domain-containing protein [Cellvibrio sp. pealriver]
MQQAKKISLKSRSSYQKLEDVIGCKWSVSVLTNVGKGINRPGELERAIEGISTKVLSERFRKLVEYGLLDKKTFNELPPRTEYSLTEKGKKLVEIIAQIQQLDER